MPERLSDRYELYEQIGQGGMGAVFRAKHLMLDREVAIKILRVHPALDQTEILHRFTQEGRIIASLRHGNIIEALDYGIDQKKIFLVLEFVKGQTLADEIDKNGRLSWSRALPLFIQTCDAIGYAHAKGIIHRDIKPSNLMITRDDKNVETIKVLDFGVAKILDPEPRNATYLPVTKAGIVFGSPPYMSPEQCSGSAPDVRSDIYSFGCVMYETLSGRTPISGENSLEILHKQITEAPLQFAQLKPAVKMPAGLEAVIMRALSKDVDTRYQTMSSLRDDLVQLEENDNYAPLLSKAPSAAQRKWLSRFNVIAVSLALSIMSAIAILSPRSPLHFHIEQHDDSRAYMRAQRLQEMRAGLVMLQRKLYKDGVSKTDPAVLDMRKLEAELNKDDR